MSHLSLSLHPQTAFTKATKISLMKKIGLVAQLNSALDYGSRGYWFESSRGHSKKNVKSVDLAFFYAISLIFNQI